MTAEERIARRFDQQSGNTTIYKKNMNELRIELAGKGLQESAWKGKKQAELHAMCISHGIVINEERSKIIPGWLGKQKGCLQVLRERGLIDATIHTEYGINGKKDLYGNVIPGTNLREIMKSCYDFSHEETLLQSMGRKMGITIDRSPKCHAELAGEGIEYSWGCQKQWYKGLPLREKRGKELFLHNVTESLKADRLSIQRIRKFAKRARSYILAYYSLNIDANNADYGDLSPQIIERLAKSFKCHRSALDFDAGFINANLLN